MPLAIAATLLASALVLVAMQGGMIFPLLALGVAAFVLLLAVVGVRRGAIATLMAAFATAPMYKGLASSPDAQVTPTDLLFLLGFVLLVPTVITRPLRLPATYLAGIILVFLTGCIGSLVSESVPGSLMALVLWLMVMGGLPIMIAWWRPEPVVVQLLLWSYVAGHMVSTAYAVLDGPTEQGRYGGLATHFNYFAQAGMLTFAIALYLFGRYRGTFGRAVVVGAGLISVYSVLLSGSRAATAVLAVLIIMVPIVERSAALGFVWAMLGALVVVALPLAVDVAGENSSLGRLAGGGGAQYSDQARELGQQEGISRFLDHPLTGSGLIDLFDIHNNYLEVAVGAGVFGLVGYLLVLYTLARPLFGEGPHRRLSYATWGYLGFGATIPSLYDRGIWAPVSLAMLAALWSVNTRRPDESPIPPEDRTGRLAGDRHHLRGSP
ncbi:O-antigen ligase family protein [Nocardioides albidus]|uniref:O-antigen ligase family protein n=1 Tax=Nocardioides albidus TaxID=1517589 RepID=A0A5C4W7G2_9ACTN|nr:O-antigen ligase family protein [Nocardioides albidus]TNM44118.1 O-antigen ligase family protein [Nocardioides albidus]